MDDNELLENYTFESRETYERALQENKFINQLKEKMDLNDDKTMLRVYNKLVADKVFATVVGSTFLKELRRKIIENNLMSEDLLPDIPVQETEKQEADTLPQRPVKVDSYQMLYLEEKEKNKKMKIALIAAIVMLIGFVFINFKFEYSIFTYFTNYKANMEEELINKYENWQADLEKREEALEKNNPN